ncbi:MAG: 30S ribosomal protein S1 [Anaerolineae bacterium]
MGDTAVARPISPDDREWWTALDEGYWQALLEQGETTPEVIPPVEPHEPFDVLEIEHAGLKDMLVAADNTQGGSSGDGWSRAQQALAQGEKFELAVVGANRGGLLVDWNGLQGFVPASHLAEIPLSRDLRERMTELTRHIGESMTVRLIEVDAQQNRLVFSERAALADFRSPAAILNSLSPGDLCQGTVTNLTSFGAFVDLGGVEGLIHVSELSWDRVRQPGDVLQPGQQVETLVLGVNAEEGRIALSLKQLRPNPWTDVGSRYYPGQMVEGQVTNVVSFGAFVRLEEGLEGLIHISELAEGNFLHPRNVVREGDTVRVRVLNIDEEAQRLGLSLRQARDVGYGHVG